MMTKGTDITSLVADVRVDIAKAVTALEHVVDDAEFEAYKTELALKFGGIAKKLLVLKNEHDALKLRVDASDTAKAEEIKDAKENKKEGKKTIRKAALEVLKYGGVALSAYAASKYGS
jgi:hypothetical protein